MVIMLKPLTFFGKKRSPDPKKLKVNHFTDKKWTK